MNCVTNVYSCSQFNGYLRLGFRLQFKDHQQTLIVVANGVTENEGWRNKNRFCCVRRTNSDLSYNAACSSDQIQSLDCMYLIKSTTRHE